MLWQCSWTLARAEGTGGGDSPGLTHCNAGQRKVKPVSEQLLTEHLTIPFDIMRSFLLAPLLQIHKMFRLPDYSYTQPVLNMKEDKLKNEAHDWLTAAFRAEFRERFVKE